MAFNGSGTFLIDSAGQPVVYNTIIDETVFNAFTADIGTGLSTCITKDGQTTPTANIPMGGFKITGLGLGTSATDAAAVQNVGAKSTCEFRLTLTSGTPVTTADVSNALTLYFTPYKGNRIALYDGTNWLMQSSAEISIAVPAVASSMFDVFVYNNAGTLTLETLQWTNDTTRATALTLQDGVLVKTGALTRRYVGSFRTNSLNRINDSLLTRWLWNYYNRARKVMRAVETTNSWNYTTATIRQANNAALNQLDFVIGVDEDIVSADLLFAASNGTGDLTVQAGIGLDTTTAFTTGQLLFPLTIKAAEVSTIRMGTAHLKVFAGVGRHYLSWNETSSAVGTTTWYGDNGSASGSQCGLHGEVWC